MAKKKQPTAKQLELDTGTTEAEYQPSLILYEQGQAVPMPKRKAVTVEDVTLEIAEKYRVGDSIPGLLRAILTELVWARLEGR